MKKNENNSIDPERTPSGGVERTTFLPDFENMTVQELAKAETWALEDDLPRQLNRLPSVVHVTELVPARAQELVNFFRGYFGKPWRRHLVARRIISTAFPRWLPSARQRHNAPAGSRGKQWSCPRGMVKVEEYAISLGFVPKSDLPRSPFERRNASYFFAVVRTLARQVYWSQAVPTLATICELFMKPRKNLYHLRSDVIPLEKLVFSYEDEGDSAPIIEQKVAKTGPPEASERR